jgi:hypothetical protein
MVGETGVMERNAGEKAEWIASMGTTLKTAYPEIKALVYFDAYSSANFGGWYDWRIETSNSSTSAFRSVATDPYFNTSATGVEGIGGGGSGGGGDIEAPTGPIVFSDGFEGGTTAAWSSSSGISAQTGGAHSGSWVVRAASSGGSAGSYAIKNLPGTYAELYASAWVKVSTQSSITNLIRLQTSTGGGIATLFLSASGELMLRNDVRRTNLWSPTRISRNAWHKVQVRVRVASGASLTEVWYDGQRIAPLSVVQDLGSTPIGRLMLGDNVGGRAYELRFDDVAVSQSPT